MSEQNSKVLKSAPKTMDEVYGDGSTCKCCPKCGMCIDHGDCAKYGCGRKKSKVPQ